ncbi:hypothetical protein AAZX31_14G086400 [Glycine max]
MRCVSRSLPCISNFIGEKLRCASRFVPLVLKSVMSLLV